MFIGHLAVALAAKRATPKVSLGVLFAAAQLPDLVWPVLVLTGTEKVMIEPGVTAFTPLNFVSYPWSHSLLMVAVTGAVFGLLYRWRTRDTAGGVVIALLAISHWVLDWVSHRPDLPLVPGGGLHGLGLWNSIPATLAIEGAMFIAGVASYAACTKARDGVGRYAFWSLILFMCVIYVADRFSPPPPSANAIAGVGIVAGIVLYFWGNWSDRHRESGRS